MTGFKETTELHLIFLNKVLIWTIYKKAFRLYYVVCFVSVYTISCCLLCHVLVILCLCTRVYYIFYLYLPLKAIRFFCCCITKKVRGWRKLHLRLQLSVKSLELKYSFDHECKMNPLLSMCNGYVLSPLMVQVLHVLIRANYQPLSPTNINSFIASSMDRDFPFNK